jgi:hypothetical protein
MRDFICTVLLSISLPLVAQPAEPDYRFEFVPDEAASGLFAESGILEITVLPPDLALQQVDSDPAVSISLSAAVTLFPGNWLMSQAQEGEPDEARRTPGELTEQEVFVREKFRLFQAADRVEQFREWLDAETFLRFSESVINGGIDLAADREIYLQYDDIRLLGSLRYGVYTLLYTQFRDARSGDLVTSVMPVRRVGGKLLTAGSLHTSSHELYRLFALGSLQQSFMVYLEERVNN